MADGNENTTKQPEEQAQDSNTVTLIADVSSHPKVLIIGETGTGKSTFINYLTNYFRKGTLKDLKVAIPTKHHPVPTEEWSNSEKDATSQQESQTSTCKQYMFNDENKHKNYIFIDTPGLGDTAGRDQDEVNIDKIQKAVLELGDLTGVIITMNGTHPRVTEHMQMVLTLLGRTLPDQVMQNIIVILTNSRPHSFNLRPDILPFQDTVVYAYTMDNSAFSQPITNCIGASMDDLQRDWDCSMNEIKKILDKIDGFSQVNVTSLQEMKEIRDAIRTKTHSIMLEIDELQQIQISVEDYEKDSERLQKERGSFEGFLRIEKVKRKALIETPNRNTLCTHCHHVCHENCHLNEIILAGDQLFIHCSAMTRFGSRCSVCPGRCSFSKHYHSNYRIEEFESTREEILTDVKSRFDEANENLNKNQERIKTMKETKNRLDESLESSCATLKQLCRNLKGICEGFDLAKEISLVIKQMQKKYSLLTSTEAQTKMKESIDNMSMFCDRIVEDQEKKKAREKVKVIYQFREVTNAASTSYEQPPKISQNEHYKRMQALLTQLHQPPAPCVPEPTISPEQPKNNTGTSLTSIPASESPKIAHDTDTDNDDTDDNQTVSSYEAYPDGTDSIYIHNIATGLSKDEIADRLSRCGPLAIYTKRDGSMIPSIFIDYRKSIAKVTFAGKWSVQEAVRRFNNKSFGFRNAPIVTVVPSIPSWER